MQAGERARAVGGLVRPPAGVDRVDARAERAEQPGARAADAAVAERCRRSGRAPAASAPGRRCPRPSGRGCAAAAWPGRAPWPARARPSGRRRRPRCLPPWPAAAARRSRRRRRPRSAAGSGRAWPSAQTSAGLSSWPGNQVMTASAGRQHGRPRGRSCPASSRKAIPPNGRQDFRQLSALLIARRERSARCGRSCWPASHPGSLRRGRSGGRAARPGASCSSRPAPRPCRTRPAWGS